MKQVKPLVEVFETIADPRAAGGRRYELSAILMLVSGAMLCGYDNLNQIAEWGRAQPAEFLRAMGFRRGQAPGKSQLYEVMSRIVPTSLEAALSEWGESVLSELQAADGLVTEGRPTLQGIALDGKTLRGSKQLGAGIAHLLSAVSHGVGITLAQVGVDAKTNEIPLAAELLQGLLLEGRVLTMDALLTQRALAQQITEGGGDYLMVVKDNQPTLAADIALALADFSPSEHGAFSAEQCRPRSLRATYHHHHNARE